MQHIYKRGHYNSIILQPTTACARHCTGCYVKNFEKTNNVQRQLDVPEWMSIVAFRLLMGNEFASCNQLIISLNNLPVHQAGSSSYGMAQFIESLPSRPYQAELCFTISNDAIRGYIAHDLWQKIVAIADAISISVDEFKGDPLDAPSPEWLELVGPVRARHTNINLMFTLGLVRYLQRVPDVIEDFIRKYDSVYFIAPKPDLEQPYSFDQAEAIRFMVNKYNALPKELKERKVFMDGCVDACSKQKLGCSAGINSLTIWPNQSVTGCPYSSKAVMNIKGGSQSENTKLIADMMLQGLTLVRSYQNDPHEYEFNKCKLRDLWNRK